MSCFDDPDSCDLDWCLNEEPDIEAMRGLGEHCSGQGMNEDGLLEPWGDGAMGIPFDACMHGEEDNIGCEANVGEHDVATLPMSEQDEGVQVAIGQQGGVEPDPEPAGNQRACGKDPILPAQGRKRLRGKQEAGPPAAERPSVRSLIGNSHHEAFQNACVGEQSRVRNQVRAQLSRLLTRLKQGGSISLRNGSVLKGVSHDLDDSALDKLRKELLWDLVECHDSHELVRGCAASRLIDMETKSASSNNGRRDLASDVSLRSSTVLVTWHGDFGASEVVQASIANKSSEAMCAIVAKHEAVSRHWKGIREQYENLVSDFSLQGVAVSLEVCTQTWESEGRLRLHLHAWLLQGKSRKRLTLQDLQVPTARKPFFFGLWTGHKAGDVAVLCCLLHFV